MFQLSQYPVEQISQNFQKRFNGFKESLKSATSLTKCYRLKRNVLLIRNPPIQSARPFQCAYHPLTP